MTYRYFGSLSADLPFLDAPRMVIGPFPVEQNAAVVSPVYAPLPEKDLVVLAPIPAPEKEMLAPLSENAALAPLPEKVAVPMLLEKPLLTAYEPEPVVVPVAENLPSLSTVSAPVVLETPEKEEPMLDPKTPVALPEPTEQEKNAVAISLLPLRDEPVVEVEKTPYVAESKSFYPDQNVADEAIRTLGTRDDVQQLDTRDLFPKEEPQAEVYVEPGQDEVPDAVVLEEPVEAQTGKSWWWKLAAGAGVLGAGAGLWFLLGKKRRKNGKRR